MGKHVFSHIEWHMGALAVEAAETSLPEGWVWADQAGLRSTYAVPSAFQSFAKTDVYKRQVQKRFSNCFRLYCPVA